MLEEIDLLSGLVSSEEGKKLYELARESQPGLIVEVGSHRGKSTCYLAQGSIDGAAERGVEFLNTVYAIDLWTSGVNPHWNQPEIYEDFLRQTRPWEQIIVPLMGASTAVAKAWTKPISLLFIDANHRYDAALADFKAWGKFLSPGGVLVFDDTNKIPVKRVMRHVQLTRDYDPWQTVGKLSWARRFK